jgi:glutamate synthase domain-containing protein 2
LGEQTTSAELPPPAPSNLAKNRIGSEKIDGVPMGQVCISPSSHSCFSTPIEMMEFIAEMRRLSGGKAAGFKLW